MNYFTLIRLKDNKVIYGSTSDSIAFKKDGTFKKAYKGKPRLKCSVVVRYGMSSWWQTTEVQEILYDSLLMVRFRTRNSEYIWIENVHW